MAASHPAGELSPESLAEVLVAEICAVALALLFFFLARWAAARAKAGQRPARLALVLLGLSPVVAVELAWAPYFEAPSQLFEADSTLGWRLARNARVHWLGVPVATNSRGLRGPERSLEPAPGTRRVLFLGDSVVFGFRIEADAATLPAQLEARLDDATVESVEVLNCGVGGWSPWQEAEFLRREGERRAVDLVLLGFVLNDVTEKLSLSRFGGSERGFQLEHSRKSGLEGWLAARSWTNLLRQGLARLETGLDAGEAALAAEVLSVYDLMLEPDSARVRAAWDMTLAEVRSMHVWCAARDLPFVIAVFPYTAQIDPRVDADLGAPQARLERFCRELGIPLLDLRVPLDRAIQAGQTEFDLYLDAVHPSAAGHSLLAEFLAQELLGLALFDS